MNVHILPFFKKDITFEICPKTVFRNLYRFRKIFQSERMRKKFPMSD
jgi:hypothetical protein